MAEYTTADDALNLINDGERIFIHGGAATPRILIEALCRQASRLNNIDIVHIHTEGEALHAHEEYSDQFLINSFFTGANLRQYIGRKNVQYVPVFLSEIPALFRRNILPPDVSLIQVSEPDSHGFCSLGVSVDIARAATDVSKKIIALVNRHMPRSHGDGQIHISRFNAMVKCNEPIFELERRVISPVERKIGEHVASIIENGSTLQMGIGGIPDAVLQCLTNHRDLGIHTEMFSDGILPLVEKGVITGRFKKSHPGKIVSSFCLGTRKLYDFLHDNPIVAMLDVAYVNDISVIRKNPKVVAINSAVEIDLTGQVCADSVGRRIISGVGGQIDFIRGASLSEGGKPVIAMPSITPKGESKIVPFLKEGAGVVTTRAHVHFVITEYGIADLYGKNLAQRARSLTGIAHPDHREMLERSFNLR